MNPAIKNARNYFVYGNQKLSKKVRCHSRKRFVKLVMAYGYSKNAANDFADILIIICGSYQIAYMRFAMNNLICCQE